MKILLRYLCVYVLLMAGSLFHISAQKTAIYNQPDAEFRDAQELFNKEKFGAAQQKFLSVVNMTKGQISELSAQSEYYAAMCALELFNADAEYFVVQYVRNHPEHTNIYKAWFQLGRYHFRFKKYPEAMAAFNKVDKIKLNDEEKNEYNFKTGYCSFINGDLETAKNAFFELKDKDSKYAAGATYYFAHISYSEKKYETALKSFQKIKTDEVYGKYTPYYITQIYYIQGKYDELLKVAPGLLDSATSKRAPEIARMIGSAYFKTQKYFDAIPYLNIYLEKNAANATRDDYYELGYCYYQTNDPENALTWFRKINTDPADSLSQSALYHLGDCYMKTGQNIAAINCFNMAYKLGIDAEISENALFNYAKLGYETGYNPYNEAINSFQKYITEYPASPHLDEAYEFLSNLYLSTRNYRDALVSLENIKKRDTKLNKAYQKICYFRGVELFNDSYFTEAVAHFNKSLQIPLNAGVAAKSNYWKGEAWYRQEAWDSALSNYQRFLGSAGAFELPEFNMANYNSGYCYFKKKNYTSALTAFRKFISNIKNEKPLIINDAYLRAGDCFFMSKDYNSAIEFYDKSIAMKLIDNDYALYQKALAYGPLGKLESKAAMLTELANNYPNSSYLDDALYETGNTWQNLGNNQKAIAFYDRLGSSCPNSIYISKALLKKGLIYYNTNQDENAMKVLKQVVSDYRGTPESAEALVALRNVYVSMDKVPEFFVYVESLGGTVSDDVQDSLTYIAVENKYMDNDCKSSVTGFSDYLTRFPNGQFALDANFYRSECQYRDGNVLDALNGYAFVIGKPSSKYTETSLSKAAEITFSEKNYKDALSYFSKLEDVAQYKNNITTARSGEMRCYYFLGINEDAMKAANHLLTTEKLPDELAIEAHLIIGRCAMATDSISIAVAEFTTVSKMSKSEMATEAKWNLGYIQYLKGNYQESEKIAFDLINQVPSYDYWVAKAFILLADNYVKMGNNRQAKYTLQSIIDNYEGADLVKEAQDKLNLILEAEKQEDLIKQQQVPPDKETPQDETSPGKF